MQENLNQKTINNAIISYFLIFISGVFVFNKSNPYINNDFVKSHAKSAFLIHIFILINYIIFIAYGLGNSITFLNLGLNNFIANIFFVIQIIFIIFGMYKASKKERFKIGNIVNINKNNEKILDINDDQNFNEKDKLTIFLNNIPFISYLIFAKYRNNKIINNSVKLNLFISVLISLIFIIGYGNLASLLSLVFITYIAFTGVTLFSTGSVININLPKVFSPSYKIIFQKSLVIYMKSYFSSKFKEFNKILEQEEKNKIKLDKILEKELKEEKETKIPKVLIYIPIINLFTLFNKNNKYKIHIENGLIISLLFIINLVLIYLNILNSETLILYIFPILFGIGYLNNNILSYRMPYIYEIYHLIAKLFRLIGIGSKEIKRRKEEEHELNLKVK